MSELLTIDLKELQHQIWDCVRVNADNPIGYKLLDAHFAHLERLMAAARLDELKNIAGEENISGIVLNKAWIDGTVVSNRIAQLTHQANGETV